jgi:hypothetical protein
MAVCQNCNGLNKKDAEGNDWPRVTLAQDVQTLNISGRDGCLTCSVLYDGLLRAVPRLFQNHINLRYRFSSGGIHQERHCPFLIICIGVGLEEEEEVEYFFTQGGWHEEAG